MDTRTIDILDRSLKGDSGALGFLERTASIYVFDGTNSGQPKTYGCWDFLNQALNEIERYEDWTRRQQPHQSSQWTCLDGHVQLLATMSRRAARRSPASDQRLIKICLANASQYHGSPDQARQLVAINSQLRERVMGRIAAIVFDFSFHRPPSYSNSHPSAFSNPISIEFLCSIAATNAIASGPDEFIHLVEDWIVPSVSTMPPFSIASVAFHLAGEAMGKAAPTGTRDTLKNKLFKPIISEVLGPVLVDAIRESDTGARNDASTSLSHPFQTVNNHRIAAMAIKALDKWCIATQESIVVVMQICSSTNVNILEVISDALYSDSAIVMDSMAELFDTLLRKHQQDLKSMEGFSVVNSFMQRTSIQSPQVLKETQQMMNNEQAQRETILAELITAVGLQRFRFMSCQNRGDTDVCRCLARIVTSTSIASRSLIRSGRLESSPDGMIDLLMKAVSHPSLHVCGIALEALPSLIQPGSQLAIQLLPILQGKAIIPPCFAGLPSSEECGVDIHEYENFRENLLSEALVACYISCRSYYIESCSSAIEEFCTSHPNPQLHYQLEAAIFCLCAVSIDASKRALLVGKSPAVQAAAARASTPKKGSEVDFDIAKDAKVHDDQLARCVIALSRSSNFLLSNPVTLARMCRFFAKYANWLSKTSSVGVLDSSAELALKSFNQTTSILTSTPNSFDFIEDMRVSPLTEATTALRNILYRSPNRFATPQALAALRNGWQISYKNADSTTGKIEIADRETLCSGICRVLAVLPADQWSSSLTVLVQPTIDCLENTTKIADGIIQSPTKQNPPQLHNLLSRISEEIRILSTITRIFSRTTVNDDTAGGNGDINPLFPIFQLVWPILTHVAQNFGAYDSISNVLSDFLTVAVSIKDDSNAHNFLKDLSEMAATIMSIVVKSKESSSLVPILEFVAETTEIYGHLAEECAILELSSTAMPSVKAKHTKDIIDRLLYLSFETVNTSLTKGSEQGRGQMPFESSSRLENTQKKKTSEFLSGFFSILTSCINRCPTLLIHLRFRSELEDDGIFVRSVDTAASAINEKESEVSRSAMIYLKSVIMLESSCRNKGNVLPTSELQTIRNGLNLPSLTKSVGSVRKGLILCLITGACGVFQQELIDPAASLLYLILSTAPPSEAEQYSSEALRQEKFALGENARNTTLIILGKCAQGTAAQSHLMDALADIWQMHQSDEAEGAIAGGDAVTNFVQKYSSTPQ